MLNTTLLWILLGFLPSSRGLGDRKNEVFEGVAAVFEDKVLVNSILSSKSVAQKNLQILSV